MGYLGQIFPFISNDESSEPGNRIPVVDGNSPDINNGFGGKFVWIVASYHNNESTAISDIKIDIQDEQDTGRHDLASGTGGKFRYLSWRNDGSKKITTLQLLRRRDQVTWDTVRNLGFDGWTSDINAGRGGDFLHLVWKH
ncbi:hypothetical protein N7490_002270 [Penicillium lividum]|nr:hypothetical protein N7490_002270 [Penicillium lividum]